LCFICRKRPTQDDAGPSGPKKKNAPKKSVPKKKQRTPVRKKLMKAKANSPAAAASSLRQLGFNDQ
jgi:hypothetical protein